MGGPAQPGDAPLAYEETPMITPVDPQDRKVTGTEFYTTTQNLKTPEISAPHEMLELPEPKATKPVPKPVKAAKSIVNVIVIILIFVVLFGVGIFASMAFRQIMPNGIQFPVGGGAAKDEITPLPTPQIVPEDQLPVSTQSGIVPTKFPQNISQNVLMVGGKSAVPGLNFVLPATVAALSCDGNNCASQGAYLPGGSRFTIAARGKGQGLPITKGAKLVDSSGKAFDMSDQVVAGFTVRQFVGNTSGSTMNGFTFSKIRGNILTLSNDLELEMSVFAPAGQIVSWENDNKLFDQIVASVIYDSTQGSTVLTLTPTRTLSSTPTISTPTVTSTSTPTPTIGNNSSDQSSGLGSDRVQTSQ